MKKMWIHLKRNADINALTQQLGEIGRVEKDPNDQHRLTLTFHNQSEGGIRMAGFRLSQDFIKFFEDFDMVADK
ncbi:MAG: hypothetical protein RBS57_03570 [Desulforhabdus sp.]|jgi:hypothetical protein|nr:hypothetical protein [Desulforhabdus sp.]